MSITIARFRQSVARTRELQPQVDRLEKQFAAATELYHRIQASTDSDEMRVLKDQMKVCHPLALAVKLSEARSALHNAKMANMQRLSEAREETHNRITEAAGGLAGLHANPRARLMRSQLYRAIQAAYKTSKEDRPAQYDMVLEVLTRINGELEKVRDSTADLQELIRKGKNILAQRTEGGGASSGKCLHVYT
jgi:hypothetical protein